MPVNQDVLINVQAKYSNAGMSELKTALKDAVKELDALRQSGQQGTQVWDDQKSKILGLSQTINGLGREYRGLDANVKMSKFALLEYGENLTIVANGFKQAIAGIKETAKEFLTASTKMQSATMGLESIAKFKGIDSKAAVDSLKNLDLVKNGLLTISDASLALKNLLASGFSLEQSITLIKRFGDAAAFGRQSSLEFGYAITSATEGIKNQNSMLVDNAGVTKNISVIMAEGGMKMQDLSDATKKQAAIQVLYTGLLRETEGQLGDAKKLTETYAGSQAMLDAQTLQLKQNFGVFLQKGLNPVMSVLTKLPSEVQATAYAFGTLSKTLLDLVPVLAMVAEKLPAIGASIATLGAGSLFAGFAIILSAIAAAAALVTNAIYALGQAWKAWTGDWKETTGYQLIWKRFFEDAPEDIDKTANETKTFQTYLQDLNNELATKEELLKNGYKLENGQLIGLTEDEIKGLTKEIKNLQDQISREKALKVAKELTDELFQMVKNGMKIESVRNEINALTKGMDITKMSISQIQTAFSNMSSSSIASILGISDAMGKSTKVATLFAEAIKMAQSGDFIGALAKYNEIKGEIAKLEAPTTPKGSNRGSNTNIEKEVKLTEIQELIEKNKELDESLLLLISTEGEQIKTSKIYNEILQERIKNLQEIDRLRSTDFRYKEPIKLESKDIVEEIPTEARYKTIQKEPIINKTITEIVLKLGEGINDFTGRFSDSLNNMSMFFGSKGKEFISDLVNGFQRISGIVNTIISMIEATKGISSFISMLLPGGAGLAKASGGYISGAGTGTSDSIPAWLSNGEYVINARSTAMYLPLLNAINGGNPYTTIAKYANGGYVNRGNLNSNVRLEVADVKLKGSDLHLSWRRQDRLETGRKG